MHVIADILERHDRGQSDRAIAHDLGLSRVTVRKYRELAEAGQLSADDPRPNKGGNPSGTTISTVLPYQAIVERFLEQGVQATTIFDRLREDHKYTGSYGSVLRFVQKHRPATPKVTVRVHTQPGEEAQVDFGNVGPFVDPNTGFARPAYGFVMTLGFSRHQYAELVFDQKIPTWLALHRNAFHSFGGRVERVVIDNLKAAVLKASLHDPVLGEAYRRFARHYGFLISPNRPATPEHKGKVESGIKFLQRSALAGREFTDIREANRWLATWVRERAGTREHGTTHQPPLAMFETYERAKLKPLPDVDFELTEVRLVTLHRDCHVVIDGSYYSAPFQHVGQRLEAYIFERVVQLFKGTALLATHVRAATKGTWRTNLDHYPPAKAAYLERTPRFCRDTASRIGPATFEVVDTLLAERPLDRLRSVQAILRLTETVGKSRLEAACKRALHFGDARYRRIKDILNAALDKQPLPDTPAVPKNTQAFLFARSVEEFFDDELLAAGVTQEGQPC